MAGHVAPLGHQAGDARENLHISGDGLRMKTTAPGGALPIFWISSTRNALPGRPAGITVRPPASFGSTLGRDLRFGAPGVGVRQGARLHDPQRAVAGPSTHSTSCGVPKCASSLHAPIGQGVQVDLRQAGFLRRGGGSGTWRRRRPPCAHNFFFLADELRSTTACGRERVTRNRSAGLRPLAIPRPRPRVAVIQRVLLLGLAGSRVYMMPAARAGSSDRKSAAMGVSTSSKPGGQPVKQRALAEAGGDHLPIGVHCLPAGTFSRLRNWPA